jgi:uncharacterized protein (DUF1499 family)
MAFVSHAALPMRTSLAKLPISPAARVRTAPTAELSMPNAGALAAFAAATVFVVFPGPTKALSLAAPRPSNIGVRSERYLASCPAGSQNCISSLDDVYSKTYVPSWTYNNPLPDEKRTPKIMDQAVTDLVQVLGNYEGEGVQVVTNRATKSEVGVGHYVYAEFRTKLLGFVDDVEFVGFHGWWPG